MDNETLQFIGCLTGYSIQDIEKFWKEWQGKPKTKEPEPEEK